MATIVIPRAIAEKVRREAEKLGISLEEYLLELISRDLDPKSKAKEFIRTAIDLLEQAREEFEKENLRQAAEKIWGACALSIKAYAYWKEGKRLSSHKELWEYKDVVVKEIGEWVKNSWFAASSMHMCFYEGWCTKTDVERALKEVEKIVEEISKKIKP